MLPTLTLKNIPDDLYERLKQRAAEHRRSLNSEILVCLERALLSERTDPQALLARTDALRARAAVPPVTDELLTEARARMARPVDATEPARDARRGAASPPEAAAAEPGDEAAEPESAG